MPSRTFLALLAAARVSAWRGHLRRPLQPPRRQLQPRRAEAAAPEPPATEVRPPYALSGLERPTYRGTVMGFLHDTGAWYALSAAYVFAALSRLPRPGRLPALALRTALVAASSFSLYITDRYHNADKRREGVSEDGELANLRCDYVGISLVLSTNLWLWSRNLGIGPRLGLWSAAATAHVLAQSVAVVPRYAGHVAVKLTLATQFVGLLGALVIVAARSAVPACAAIYAAYAWGFVLYAFKVPKDAVWGYHEYFHASNILGNVMSMGFDLYLLGLF